MESFVDNGALAGGVNGPVFVNPYDANNIYAVIVRGVEVSNDGGQSFQADKELTSLVTRFGIVCEIASPG